MSYLIISLQVAVVTNAHWIERQEEELYPTFEVRNASVRSFTVKGLGLLQEQPRLMIRMGRPRPRTRLHLALNNEILDKVPMNQALTSLA